MTYTTMAHRSQPLRPDDVVIAIMGPPHAGKSHFIQTFSTSRRHEESAKTHVVQTFPLKEHFHKRVVLVELPAFDNARRSDMEVLFTITNWLKDIYKQKVMLAGVLYMHRIADNRMNAIALHNLQLFFALFGDMGMDRAFLVTTTWDKIPLETATLREDNLRAEYWGDVIGKGWKMKRFGNSIESARNIIDEIIMGSGTPEALFIQEELVKSKKRLSETQAGRLVFRNLQRLVEEETKVLMQMKIQKRAVQEVRLAGALDLEIERTQSKIQKTSQELEHLKISTTTRLGMTLTRTMSQRRLSTKVQRNPTGSRSDESFKKMLRDQLTDAMLDQAQRNFMRQLADDEAQEMVNYLNLVLRESSIFDKKEGKHMLSMLEYLAKEASVHPQCLDLRGVTKHKQGINLGGTFGDVYQGTYESQDVCVKVVRIFGEQDRKRLLRMYVKEIILWSHLDHQNILPFLGVYIEDESKRLCLISPWMKNGNLKQYLKKNIDAPQSLLLLDVIRGLEYLHGRNIVHGDLKAENILVSDGGYALIGDFGLSHVESSTTTNFASTFISHGTPGWIAPELYDSDDCDIPAKATIYSDMWSFGCLCYEVLEGKKPYDNCRNEFKIILRQREGKKPGSLEEHHLKEFVDQCWNIDPMKRPSCTRIRKYMEGLNIRDKRPVQAVGNLASMASVFWTVTRTDLDKRIDYGRIEKILLRIWRNTGGIA